MSFDLTNKNISDTYQNLLQKTGSDGKLFDLLGNPIKDLTIQGALIAESYIVSQSSTIHSSGSTAFGNTTDDTHTFIGDINTTGHITASGNISASGDDHILGGSIFVGKHDGQNKYHFDRFSSDVPLAFIQAGSQDLDTEVGLGLLIRDSNGAPTRGLTISSSGFVQVNDIFFSKTIPEALTVEGNISASGDFYLDTDDGNVFLGGGGANKAALILTDVSNNYSASLIQSTLLTSLKLTQANTQDFSIDTNASDNSFYIEGAAGNVGIGTNNPSEKLTVVGNINATGDLSVRSGSFTKDVTITHTDDPKIVLKDTTNNFTTEIQQLNTSTIFRFDDNASQELLFVSNGDGNHMFLDGNSGNTGIGTQTANSKLQVDGDITATNITASGDISSSGLIKAYSFLSNGIGIGIHLAGTDFLGAATTKTKIQGTNIELAAPVTASGNISSSGTMTMLTASIGGGIFTSASLAAGGSGGSGTITALNNQTANRLVSIGSTTTELDGEANLTYDGTTFTVNDTMQVSSGDLTVGGDISSSGDLYLEDGKNIKFTGIGRGNLNGTDLTLSASTTNITLNAGNDIVFQTGSQIAMVIDGGTGGNVGIGTSLDPSKKLTVRGDISASGQLNVGNYDSTDGHITASGNISSSGAINSNQVLVQGETALALVEEKGFVFSDAQVTKLQIGKAGTPTETTIHGNITASGDISSSGDLISNNLFIDSQITHNGDTDTKLTFTDNALRATIGNTVNANFYSYGTQFDLPITASGNISGSSTSNIIIGGDFKGLTANSQLIMGHQTTDDTFVKAQISHHTNTVAPVSMDFLKSRGTLESPATVAQGDFTGTQRYYAHDGSSYRLSAAIRGDVDGGASVGTNVVPGALNFLTTTNGSLNSRMFIASTGNVGINNGSVNSLPSKTLTVQGDISGSGDVFIGDPDGAYFSSSLGNVELSGSGKGQLEVDYRLFDTASINPAIGTGIGDIVKFGGTSTNAGQVYYLQNNGTWAVTDADAGGTTSGSIAVALGTNSTNDGMLLNGIVTLDHDPGGHAGLGAPVYLSTTAGRTSVDAPGSGDFARIIGYKISGSFGIYFKPDNTTIEVA